MNDLKSILVERTPFYEQAHAILDTSGKTVEQSYNDLLTILQEHANLEMSPAT